MLTIPIKLSSIKCYYLSTYRCDVHFDGEYRGRTSNQRRTCSSGPKGLGTPWLGRVVVFSFAGNQLLAPDCRHNLSHRSH